MKYAPRVFKDSLPKGKKTSILVKIFYRPISYIISSIVAQFGVTANAVSYFSSILAVIACICFVTRNYTIEITGAILINIWLILDCVDGNLARTIRKQPYGEFADAMSSYILVGLIGVCMGISAYFEGGLLFQERTVWIVLLGAVASSSDTLMRLNYQKFKNTSRELIDKGILKEKKSSNKSLINKIKDKVEMELGIGGILPILILIGTIFKALDIVIIYCFLYYFLSFLFVTSIQIKETLKSSKSKIL